MKINYMILKNVFIVFFIAIFLLSPIMPTFASEFDPSLIITDAEINDYRSMSYDDVVNFLKKRGGILDTYTCEDKSGRVRKASEIIYTLSQENKINPKFMLVLLQKEQSLLEDSSPSNYQLTAATGYGCPDSGGCNQRWASFFKQVNSAYLQFRSYLDEANLYRYKSGKTYIFNNSNKKVKTIDIVTPKNQATAALYNYTPHVYYGNYNFWKLWRKYFPNKRKVFPDGSLLRLSGSDDVYLIQNGEKRLFSSMAALLSRFSLDRVVDVGDKDISSYNTGTPIRFPNYSLLRSPDEDIYLTVNDVIRKVSSDDVFRGIGFNPDEVVDATFSELSDYVIGMPITEKDAYPTGALLQNNKTGGVYFVINGQKFPIWSKEIMKINYSDKKIISVGSDELEKYKTGVPVKFREGELIKSKNSPVVYVISNGRKRAIASEETFLSLGYRWGDIIEVSNKILEIHPTGENIDMSLNNIVEAAIISE